MEIAGNFHKKKTSLNQAGPLQRGEMKSLQVVSNLIKYCTNSLFYLDIPFMGKLARTKFEDKEIISKGGVDS